MNQFDTIRALLEGRKPGPMYLEIKFKNRNDCDKAEGLMADGKEHGHEAYYQRTSEIEVEKETMQFFDCDSKEILKMLKKERGFPKFKIVADERM